MWPPRSRPFFLIARIQGMESTHLVLSIFMLNVYAFGHAKVPESWSFLPHAHTLLFFWFTFYHNIERRACNPKNSTPWEAQCATCIQVWLSVLIRNEDQINFFVGWWRWCHSSTIWVRAIMMQCSYVEFALGFCRYWDDK